MVYQPWWLITIEVILGIGCLGGIGACIFVCFNGAILDFLAYSAFYHGIFNNKFETHSELADWIENQYRFFTGFSVEDDIASVEALFA